MTKIKIAGGVGAVLVLLALVVCSRVGEKETEPPEAAAPADTLPVTEREDHPSFLYGRVTTRDGATYEGRLRWGGGEEAFWGDYFNGFKDENRWSVHVPAERLPTERQTIEIFGFELASRENPLDLGRPFMARFGDISRIEARGRDIRVTLKSGTVFDLDRFSADDLADGVRVWDGQHGVVDIGERRIDTIELFPGPPSGAAPSRLHGRVHTRQGVFTGFIQWDREEGVGSDRLDGRTADGELGVRFDTIGSIARGPEGSCLVTLHDGLEIELGGTRETGQGNRGMYVDDPRYGRVLVSWEAFERVDFSPGGSGPVYEDFPPGGPLMGSVTTRDGRRLEGRLVFDLDESETTETLDAPSGGVDYTIPFGKIASIVPPRVTLHGGDELQLEPAGDLGKLNAGMLVFIAGGERAEYLSWAEVERIDFDRPGLD